MTKKVREVLEFLKNCNPEADVYIETEFEILDITSITEDRMGINFVNEPTERG